MIDDIAVKKRATYFKKNAIRGKPSPYTRKKHSLKRNLQTVLTYVIQIFIILFNTATKSITIRSPSSDIGGLNARSTGSPKDNRP